MQGHRIAEKTNRDASNHIFVNINSNIKKQKRKQTSADQARYGTIGIVR